jgi:uncharacterized protein YdhG (YjbR/CyaY superfamily)
MKKVKTVEEYIATFPGGTQAKLKQLREIVKKAAPKAVESISYGMPYYSQQGRLVYFAAFKNHIGFYPLASAVVKFQKEISVYKHAKGSVQFPLEEKIPVGLVSRIVKFRVKENEERATLKGKKK